jgi:phenylacetate-CoA ligase
LANISTKVTLSDDRESLRSRQLSRLNELLREIMPVNRFYQDKFRGKAIPISSLEEWSTFPTSTKSDWQSDGENGIARHHSFEESRYRRYHRTSGTKGKPMVILDTDRDWKWWIEAWQTVLDASTIDSKDRVMMAFSFGPFIGFWSAHDACLERGCMVIPCGGMSTAARIEMIQAARPTVLFSTPSYALHLARDAALRGIDLRRSSIRLVFVAGEPGGSAKAIRSRIEAEFGAKVMDHAGATEVGPWGFGSEDGSALHVNENEFIAELEPQADGLHELILTALGRTGAPVLRYRTGDLVRPHTAFPSNSFLRLEGGVLGRSDDMIVVRGVNVFPSSVDAIIRSFPEILEYRLLVTRHDATDSLRLEIEASRDATVDSDLVESLSEKLAIQLNLRFNVIQVPVDSLPRSDGKARRVHDQRRLVE